MMKVGQVVEVAVASASSPGSDGMYQILVKVQSGMHKALLDQGSSLIHQSLVRPEAMVDVSWVRIGCIYGDLQDYPLLSLEICHQGKKHNVKAVISSQSTY